MMKTGKCTSLRNKHGKYDVFSRTPGRGIWFLFPGSKLILIQRSCWEDKWSRLWGWGKVSYNFSTQLQCLWQLPNTTQRWRGWPMEWKSCWMSFMRATGNYNRIGRMRDIHASRNLKAKKNQKIMERPTSTTTIHQAFLHLLFQISHLPHPPLPLVITHRVPVYTLTRHDPMFRAIVFHLPRLCVQLRPSQVPDQRAWNGIVLLLCSWRQEQRKRREPLLTKFLDVIVQWKPPRWGYKRSRRAIWIRWEASRLIPMFWR